VAKKAEIKPEIGIAEEGALLSAAALGHMVGDLGEDQSGGARHGCN
jgi:hypothetical protein